MNKYTGVIRVLLGVNMVLAACIAGWEAGGFLTGDDVNLWIVGWGVAYLVLLSVLMTVSIRNEKPEVVEQPND